jgi:hypothetical protein
MAEAGAGWSLTEGERATLVAALDGLLPPAGSFPAPSATGMIDAFILRRVPATDATVGTPPYPRIDSDGLRAILAALATLAADLGGMTAALAALEREQPAEFTALWRLAVYGYYSRLETIAAIQRDLAPAYHGAPLPLGYAHAMAPWDAADPLQMPAHPRGRYTRTEDVRRVDLSKTVDGTERQR